LLCINSIKSSGVSTSDILPTFLSRILISEHDPCLDIRYHSSPAWEYIGNIRKINKIIGAICFMDFAIDGRVLISV